MSLIVSQQIFSRSSDGFTTTTLVHLYSVVPAVIISIVVLVFVSATVLLLDIIPLFLCIVSKHFLDVAPRRAAPCRQSSETQPCGAARRCFEAISAAKLPDHSVTSYVYLAVARGGSIALLISWLTPRRH